MYTAKATPLDPPVTIDATSYTAAVRIVPDSNDHSKAVVTGQLDSWEDLGGGVTQLRIRRAVQTGSRTLTIAPRQVTEVPTFHNMGGNFCLPDERQRLYAYNNPAALLGSMEGSRCVPGHAVRVGASIGEVVATEAFGHEPGEVNYSPEDPLIEPSRIRVDMNDLQLIPPDGLGVFFDPSESGVWSGASVFAWDGAVATAASRVVFDGDPFVLPADLGASGFSGAAYWYDPEARTFRLPSDWPEDEALLVWWVRGNADLPEVPNASEMVAEDCLSAVEVEGDFDIQFRVDQPCTVEWRGSGEDEAETFRLSLIVGSGGDVSASKVDASGVAALDDSAGLGLPLWVRTEKAGSTWRIYVATEAAWPTWTELSSTSMGGTIGNQIGFVGVRDTGGSGVRFLGATGAASDWVVLLADAESRHGALLNRFEDVVTSLDFPLPDDSPTRVRNITAGVDMEVGIGRRDRYGIEGSNLIGYSPADGDLILVEFPPPSPPTPPGAAPRLMAGQPDDFSTVDPGGDGVEASDDTAENRSNWLDAVNARFDTDPTLAVGASVEAFAGPVFRHGDTIEVSIWDDEEGESGAWVPASPVLVWRASGIILLDVPEGTEVKVDAPGWYRHSAGFDAAIVNELTAAVEGMEDLFVRAGTTGGAGFRMYGGAVRAVGVGTHDDQDEVWWPQDFEVGLTRGGVNQRRAPGGVQLPIPHWRLGGDYHDLALRTAFTDPVATGPDSWLVQANGTGANLDIRDETVPGEMGIEVGWGGVAASFYWGSDYAPDQLFTTDPDQIVSGLGGGFDFTGYPFNPGELLQRINDGATVLQAWARARFDGLSVRRWRVELSWTVGFHGAALDQFMRYRLWIGGQLVKDFHRLSDGTVVLDEESSAPAAETTVRPSVRLIGRRHNTQQGVQYAGNGTTSPRDVPADEFAGFAATRIGDDVPEGGMVLSSGEWGIVDATPAVTALLRNRNSRFGSFFLFPGNAPLGPTSSTSSLVGLAQGLVADAAVSGTPSTPASPYSTRTANVSAQRVEFSGWEVRDLMVSLRLGSGAIVDLPIPIGWPELLQSPG